MNHEITQLVDRYIAIWHEPDAERRRRGVAHLWAEDGVQFTSSREIRGHKALEERVGGRGHRRLGDGHSLNDDQPHHREPHNGVPPWAEPLAAMQAAYPTTVVRRPCQS